MEKSGSSSKVTQRMAVWPSNSILRKIQPKELVRDTQTNTQVHIFTATLFTIVKKLKKHKCQLADECIQIVHTETEISFHYKKEWRTLIDVLWVRLEIMLSKITQTQKFYLCEILRIYKSHMDRIQNGGHCRDSREEDVCSNFSYG